jgi:hypothetical protein
LILKATCGFRERQTRLNKQGNKMKKKAANILATTAQAA